MISPKAATLKRDLGEALAKELEFARRTSSGDRTNQVKDGRKGRHKGNGFLYEFEELSGFPPEEGAQVTFTVSENVRKGRFLGEINSKFVFEIEADLGSKIDVATIVRDPLFLLEKQISILGKDVPFESQVALASIGLADFSTVGELNLDPIFMKDLNSRQADALRVVANHPVTYIWGPPGTGKTTTTGSVVAALASMGQKVLLVSNTNLALDTALERCLDRFEEVSEISSGLMLRLGTMVKPELMQKYESKIDLDDVTEEALEPLRKEVARLSANLQKLKNDISDFQDKQIEYRGHLEKSKGPASAKERLTRLNAELESEKRDVVRLLEKISGLESELLLSNSKTGFGRLFSKVRKPGTIASDTTNTKFEKDRKDEVIRQLVTSVLFNEAEIEAIEKQSVASGIWLAKHPEVATLTSTVDQLFVESVKQETAIEQIQEEMGQQRTNILTHARVVACTAYRPLLDKDVAAMKFDCVVVDEASMLPLPLYYCVASLAQSRIVVAGDFRQLPPIVRANSTISTDSPSEAQQKKTQRDLMISNPFTKSGVILRSRSGEGAPELVALRDQYRMREPISDLISMTFYPEHTLRTMTERKDKSTPWGNETFLFFDTTSLQPESSTVNGKSRRNVIHALVVRAIAERLFEDGWELRSTAEKSFGIITPYASQSRFIEKLLGANPSTHIKGGVSTVHRFQGNERDLMVIDLTKVASAIEPGLGDFVGHPVPLAPENAMWNVAISRARQHVLIVADRTTLDRNSGSVIAQLIEGMKSDMKVIDAKLLLDEDVLASLGSKPRANKGSISWFTGASFYEAFERDLVKAKSKILIASPFTTPEATFRWMPIFRDLKARDIDIVGLTRPLDEKTNSSVSSGVHTELEAVFKELRPISKMHEKLSVIDGAIVWLGSLNILSHHSATEIMVRIDSPDFAQSIIDEYQNSRFNRARAPKLTESEISARVGSKCPNSDCGGVLRRVPSGFSSRTQKSYDAFLSCSNFRITGCKGAR